MAQASVPVDPTNPGQVFACLGFMEAAETLLGDAEGGFDWGGQSDVRFTLRAAGGANPFSSVLEFLAEAEVCAFAPDGFTDVVAAPSDTYPVARADKMALPIHLELAAKNSAVMSHWADGSSRKPFKLYAGNRSAAKIAGDMSGLCGRLWRACPHALTEQPFNVLIPMGGSFNFDPRSAWTSIDTGYSPNTVEHSVAASPVVELLAALGLENARPYEYGLRQVRYGIWGVLVPVSLARPALAAVDVGLPLRRFTFTLDLSGKNKVVTFAEEEA